MRPRNMRLVVEVYKLLVEGYTQGAIARILVRREHIPEKDKAALKKALNHAYKKVSKATKYLLDNGYLTRATPTRPYHYHKGKNAPEFDAYLNNLPIEDKGVVWPSPKDEDKIRLHECSFKCNIVIMPSDDILEENKFTWVHTYYLKGGVRNRIVHFFIEPVGYVFARETITKDTRTMYFALPPLYISAKSIRTARRLLDEYAHMVVHYLSRKGYGLGLPERSKAPSYAFREPALDRGPITRVRTANAEIDFSRSPSKKFAEWETTAVELAEIRARAPELIKEALGELETLRETVGALRGAISAAVAEIKEDINRELKDLKRSIVAEIRKDLTYVPGPEDTGNGYA